MHRHIMFRNVIVAVLASVLVCPNLFALVSIDDGKNRVFVNATVSYAWDSNIYSVRNGASDGIYSASVGADFERRAGQIGVNASLYLDASSFVSNSGENFQNPRFSLELTKQTGRTTGSLLLSAAKQSRADTAANVRNESWIYDASLNLKYPVIERYSLSGGVGYSLRDFNDNTMFVDLETYSANIDLFYVYNTERDLIAGYRIRYGETSARNSYFDHAFTAGISGKVLPKLYGTFRFGYQFREPNNAGGESHSAITASGTLSWSLSKKTKIALQVSKDFTTTSTNVTVDATSFMLDATHAVNSKVNVYARGGYGINRFLGKMGGGRVDEFITGEVGINYAMFGELLTLNAGYSYLYNWSNVRFATFERNSITASASTRF